MSAVQQGAPSSSLDELAAEASADLAPAAASPDPAVSAEAARAAELAQQAAEWAQAVDVGCLWLTSAVPSLERVYTPEARKQLSDALAAVGQKYGWSFSSFWAKWAPEINLALVAVPLARATAEELRAHRAQKAKAVSPGGATGGAGDARSSAAEAPHEFTATTLHPSA